MQRQTYYVTVYYILWWIGSSFRAGCRAIAFGITSSSQAPFRGNPGISPTEKAPGMGIKENATVFDARVFTPTLTLPSTSPGTNRERIGDESDRPCGRKFLIPVPSASSGTNRERIRNESERPCGTGIKNSRPIVSSRQVAKNLRRQRPEPGEPYMNPG